MQGKRKQKANSQADEDKIDRKGCFQDAVKWVKDTIKSSFTQQEKEECKGEFEAL